jgi:hypothetical protein
MAINPKTGHRVGRNELMQELSKLSSFRANGDDINEHIAQLRFESDRGVMILAATMINDALITELGRTMPRLNCKIRGAMFGNDGPLSTFSKRIICAEAFGLISSDVAKQMDVIRKIRNAAAHAHAPVDCSLDAVKQGLATVLDSKKGDDFETWPRGRVRNFYMQLCGYIADHLIGGVGGLVAAAKSPDAIHGLYRAIQASDLTA